MAVTTTYTVTGMTCGHCAQAVTGELTGLPGVEDVLVDGAVKFWLAAPGPGRYRMVFDFKVGGTVHTAAFTTTVG